MSQERESTVALGPNYHCQRCGYNLRGVPSGRCPECGRAFDANDPTTYRASRTPQEIRRDRMRFADHWGRRLSWWTVVALGIIVVAGQRGVGCGFMLFLPKGTWLFVVTVLGAVSLIGSNYGGDTPVRSIAVALGCTLLWVVWIGLMGFTDLNPLTLVTSVPFLLTSILKFASEIVVHINRE